MFEFLRLSPSYELARLESTGTLSKEQKQGLASDFGEVRRTYELLGDVQKTLFRTWWIRRGLRAFGNPHSEPKVHGIRVMRALENVTIEGLRADLDNFLTETRPSEGLNASLLVSLPLGLRKADLLKQLDRLLNQHEAESGVHQQMPPLALVGQRLRAKVLFNGLRLLWFRAAKPRWEYWRLGAQARISKTYSVALDPNAPRRTTDHQEKVDRDLMTKITYRALMKFENIAENAARGRFPSDAPAEKASFDYIKLRALIKSKNRWEETEKARIMKAYEMKKLAAK